MMNHFFTLLLAASCLTAVGQVPDYVPTDGLVAWFPLDGNANDVGPNQFVGQLSGSTAYEGHLGNEGGSLWFEAGAFIRSPFSDLSAEQGVTYTAWVQRANSPGIGYIVGYGNSTQHGQSFCLAEGDYYGLFATAIGSSYDARSNQPLTSNEWVFVATTILNDSVVIYMNSQVVFDGAILQPSFQSDGDMWIGVSPFNQGQGEFWEGAIDEVGVWNRALSSEEIQGLFDGIPPSVGCTNESACNFNPAALVDDGSCTLADCTDPQACNFNSEAACDDGSCVYPPVVELGEDIDTCEEFVVLDAGDNHDSYLWNTGDTTQFLEVSESGEYSVDVTHWSTQSEYSLDFGLQANCGFGNTWVDCGQVFESNGSFSVGGWLFNNGCDYTTIVSQRPGGSCTDPYYGPGPYNGFHLSYENDGQFEFRLHQNSNGNDPIEPAATTPAIEEAWVHLVGVFESGQSVKLFLNGALVDSQPTSIEALEFCDYPFLIGSLQHGGNWSWDGKLDDVFAYGRALSDAEVLAIFESSYPSDDLSGLWRFEEGEGGYSYDASGNGHHGVITGATWSADVPESIAFVECSASDTIGVQLFSYACLCGEGTTWDESLGECVAVLSSQNACGGGTQWDDETQTCIVANPADINFDGCVQLNDLLDLLSAYGMCFVWQCGDLIEYQGYDYETVQIGEQCWFAENLRAEYYQNNDPLASDLSDEEWSSISIGAQSFYEYNSEILADYGRLYNGYAVLDEREICPSGWHVPTDNEFMALEVHLGMSPSEVNSSGWRGTNEGEKLKSSPSDDPAWNGNNASGFGAAAGGMRFGTFFYQGAIGSFWTAEGIYCRELHGNDQIFRDPNNNLIDGFSVRCIKDAE